MAVTDLKVSDDELPANAQDENMNTSNSVDEMRWMARKLESENPLWIVVFGIYSGQFVAFPRFKVSAGTMAVARYPGALKEKMRRIEYAMRMPRTLPSYQEIYT